MYINRGVADNSILNLHRFVRSQIGSRSRTSGFRLDVDFGLAGRQHKSDFVAAAAAAAAAAAVAERQHKSEIRLVTADEHWHFVLST